MTKSLNKIAKRVNWTAEMDAELTLIYPDIKSELVAEKLGVSLTAVYGRAAKFGIKKSAQFMSSPAACRLRRGDEIGKQFRFKPGHVSHNKGVKGISYPGMVDTQFKPGSRPVNTKPVGYIRTTADGYLEMKMAEGLRQWRLLHRVIWQRLNGKIASDLMVTFIDGNSKNIKITNLTLMSKKENALRNSYHNYGKEIAQLYQLKGAITRQINKRSAKNERHIGA
jgi:hypothetical protein